MVRRGAAKRHERTVGELWTNSAARLKSDPHSQSGRLLAEASRVVEWSPTERQRFLSSLSSAARGGQPGYPYSPGLPRRLQWAF